ncbi:MAG TPA: HEAT repeat domain-containing protein, partial [Thermomicrobiales bacterium]|nr:HEAT repeat domain-containing protein [Thermomicrobiales bacterium]
FPAETSLPHITIEECLSQLGAGIIEPDIIVALSDLSRHQVRYVSREWTTLPDSHRISTLELVAKLASERLDLDFRRFLRAALTDPVPAHRVIALANLWEDDSRSLLEEVLRLAVVDPSAEVQASAIAHLTAAFEGTDDVDVRSADLIEAFASLVSRIADSPNAPYAVRVRAIEALGVVPQTVEIRALINAAWEHGDTALAVAALLGIAHSHESRWRDLVRPELESDDAEIRYGALRALGAIGTADDVETIAKCLLDEDRDVRLAAIAALGEIAGPGAVRVLRNRANSAPQDEQDAITDALDEALLGSDFR